MPTEKMVLIHRLLLATNVTRIQSSDKAHSLARSSTGRWGTEYLPSTMWASRQSSACSQQEADSLTDHFVRPTKGSSLTSSDLGSNMPRCYLKRSCTPRARVVAVVVVAKSWSDERRPLLSVGLVSGWGSVVATRMSQGKKSGVRTKRGGARGQARCRDGDNKKTYKVYAVDVLGEAPSLKFAIWVVARHGRLERAAARHVKVRVCHEGRPSGLHVQLAAELLVLAHQLGVFLLELADAQRWWWQRRDLFGRERECGLQLRHCLLKLRGCAWPCQCMCAKAKCGVAIPARCRPFASRDALLGLLHYDCARGGRRRRTSYWKLLGPCSSTGW